MISTRTPDSKESIMVRKTPPHLAAAAIIAALAASVLTPIVQASSASAVTPTVAVDLGTSTGAFYGGGSGALYAMAQDGIPNDSVFAPLHMRTIAQKPDGATGHPSGDMSHVAPEFFRTGGSQEFIYMQDLYATWPYQNDGIPSYQAAITPIISTVVASPYRSKFVYVPFNEPDNIWYDLHSGDSGYAASRDQFFQDWKTVYNQIESADPGAKIAGPNTSGYDSTFIREFLTFAKANNVLPAIMTWHSLGDGWPAYRSHYADYRSIEQTVGISPLPINIDEYAQRSDQSVPGKMVQWLAAFEDTKSDGMQAFWGTTEDVQASVVGTNEATSQWWLMRWYGALTGNTVKLTPPSPTTQDTVQGIATLDSAKKQSRILLGGGSGTTNVAVSNIPSSVFGTSVHVQVQLDRMSDWEATAQVPPTIAEGDYAVTGGSITIPLPSRNADDAFQVILTPSSTVGSSAPTSPPSPVRYEAENAAITNATVYSHSGMLEYPSSNGKNVGSFSQSTSRITYTVNAPVTGQYQLDIMYGSQALTLTQQIMKVDSGAWQYVTYAPTLDFARNGKTTLYLSLSAGTHTITFGVSDPSIGNTGSDITQDAIDLTALTAATTTTKEIAQRYEAEYADLTGASTVATSASGYTGTAYVDSSPSSQAGSTTVVVNAQSNGYYDVSARYRTSGSTAAPVTRSVDGQVVSSASLAGTSGAWSEAPMVVWLKAGINQITFSQAIGAAGFGLDRVDVTPVVGSTAALAPTYESEAATLAGSATVQSSSYASGGSYVVSVGSGSGNTLTFGSVTAPRTGTYVVNVRYANAERPPSTSYNTELVDRYADVTTTTASGASTQRVYFKNTYAPTSFRNTSFYVNLTAGTNSISFGNATGWTGDVDYIQVAPVVQPATAVEAEAAGNTRTGTAVNTSLTSASGGSYVGYIGNGAANTLTVNGLTASATGTGYVLIRYASGDTRTASVSVNGGTAQNVTFPSTGGFTTWADLILPVSLTAGSSNTVAFANSSAYVPDIDKVAVVG